MVRWWRQALTALIISTEHIAERKPWEQSELSAHCQVKLKDCFSEKCSQLWQLLQLTTTGKRFLEVPVSLLTNQRSLKSNFWESGDLQEQWGLHCYGRWEIVELIPQHLHKQSAVTLPLRKGSPHWRLSSVWQFQSTCLPRQLPAPLQGPATKG